jgi:hypothetical protein
MDPQFGKSPHNPARVEEERDRTRRTLVLKVRGVSTPPITIQKAIG